MKKTLCTAKYFFILSTHTPLDTHTHKFSKGKKLIRASEKGNDVKKSKDKNKKNKLNSL